MGYSIVRTERNHGPLWILLQSQPRSHCGSPTLLWTHCWLEIDVNYPLAWFWISRQRFFFCRSSASSDTAEQLLEERGCWQIHNSIRRRCLGLVARHPHANKYAGIVETAESHLSQRDWDLRFYSVLLILYKAKCSRLFHSTGTTTSLALVLEALLTKRKNDVILFLLLL